MASRPQDELEIGIASGLEHLDPEEWDALVGDNNPFVEHAFLRLLESSGSVGPGTGWVPHHLFARQKGGALVGAMPLYLKTDSYGEYIFDWGWADAAHRAGVPYYPKLTSAVPFTPATGPRLLVRPDLDRALVVPRLLAGLERVQEELGALSTHLLFTLDEEARELEAHGFLRRATHQYHFRNDAYSSFDDFLDRLKSSARKEIRKERRRVTECGLEIESRRGDELSHEEWMRIDALYRATSGRKWGRPYLTRAFFAQAAERVGERARVFLAKDGGEIVAMSLSFEKGRHIYGRYWGCARPVDGLHFELCYYRLIEHAIEQKMTLVEAGAQGEHKMRRGFVPVAVHSAHRFQIPGLHAAIGRFVEEEADELHEALPELAKHVPFKEGATPNILPLAGLDR